MLAEPVLVVGLGEVGGAAVVVIVVRRVLVGRCGACGAGKSDDSL